MYKVLKSISSATAASAERDIDLVNQFTLREFKPEDVFVFRCIMCDDRVDRDNERIIPAALEKLSKMFVGKPLLSDHRWEAGRMIGRIYAAEVVKNQSGVSELVGRIYIPREGNADLISRISGGLLKEVSVGFASRPPVCSCCGSIFDYDGMCKSGHVKGERDSSTGSLIHAEIRDPLDAYELSFVAVPAQTGAGTIKAASPGLFKSAEENAFRKALHEELTGRRLSDSEWESHCRKAAEKRSAEEKKKAEREERFRRKLELEKKDIPKDDFSDPENCVSFVILPESAIDPQTMETAYCAAGFARKELLLSPISIRWFCTIDEAARAGLDVSSMKIFNREATLTGIAGGIDRERIFVRYRKNDPEGIFKTVAHEIYHCFQYSLDWSTVSEPLAYEYENEALSRFKSLSEADRRDCLIDEIMQKDFSGKR